MRIGFVTWDGPAQNYMESLFLPIFEQTARQEFEFATLQFTWDCDTSPIAAASMRRGFAYESAEVVRQPLHLATALGILTGARRVASFAERHQIDVLLPRSIIPAAMVLLAKRQLPGIRMVFDADGLVADERAEYGGWTHSGLTYRLFRDIEARALGAADAVITRTDKCRKILGARAGASLDPRKVFVVPNGKDSSSFSCAGKAERETFRDRLGVPADAPLVVYAGSIGPQYHAAEMVQFFRLVLELRPDAHFHVLTGNQAAFREQTDLDDLPPDQWSVTRVAPHEVPLHLSAADLGLGFRQPSFSQQAVAPIKIAEYLLCGLPVLTTSGVGDLDAQIDGTVGRIIDRLDLRSLAASARWFVYDVLPARGDFREACRRRGVEHFSLSAAAEGYANALRYAIFGRAADVPRDDAPRLAVVE